MVLMIKYIVLEKHKEQNYLITLGDVDSTSDIWNIQVPNTTFTCRISPQTIYANFISIVLILFTFIV